MVIFLYIIDISSGGSVRALVRGSGAWVWSMGASLERAVGASAYFGSRRALEIENASLAERLDRAQERAAAYAVLLDENKLLREMLKLASARGVTAPVASSFRASPYGTFVIGAGAADGISAGDVVLTSENFVIGRVEETSLRNALVRALFAPGVNTDALLSGTGITAEGQGGGNARAAVSLETPAKEGDPVISPVFGGRAIGVVGAVSEDAARGGKTVYIRLPVNLSALRFVYLVKQ